MVAVIGSPDTRLPFSLVQLARLIVLHAPIQRDAAAPGNGHPPRCRQRRAVAPGRTRPDDRAPAALGESVLPVVNMARGLPEPLPQAVRVVGGMPDEDPLDDLLRGHRVL